MDDGVNDGDGYETPGWGGWRRKAAFTQVGYPGNSLAGRCRYSARGGGGPPTSHGWEKVYKDENNRTYLAVRGPEPAA